MKQIRVKTEMFRTSVDEYGEYTHAVPCVAVGTVNPDTLEAALNYVVPEDSQQQLGPEDLTAWDLELLETDIANEYMRLNPTGRVGQGGRNGH